MIVERNGKTTTYKVEQKPVKKAVKMAPVKEANKEKDIEKEADNGYEK